MWLVNVTDTAWAPLANALRAGLPVPEGFVVSARTPELDVRAAYEDLKTRTRTHFVAVRGPSHAVLNLVGPDQLIHTLRRLWAESPDAVVLIQRMVPALWCGKTQWREKNLRIEANEGMMILDPDTYLYNTETGECIEKAIEPRQRKMIRYVDGTPKTVERNGERPQLTDAQLKQIADLAERARSNIGWAFDDQDRVWLLGVNPK